jgi:hypothetical protein
VRRLVLLSAWDSVYLSFYLSASSWSPDGTAGNFSQPSHLRTLIVSTGTMRIALAPNHRRTTSVSCLAGSLVALLLRKLGKICMQRRWNWMGGRCGCQEQAVPMRITTHYEEQSYTSAETSSEQSAQNGRNGITILKGLSWRTGCKGYFVPFSLDQGRLHNLYG